MMNDEPMPEAIKELVQNPEVTDARKSNNFVLDFDVRPNLILYHTHVESKKQHVFVKNSEQQEFHGVIGKHGWIEPIDIDDVHLIYFVLEKG